MNPLPAFAVVAFGVWALIGAAFSRAASPSAVTPTLAPTPRQTPLPTPAGIAIPGTIAGNCSTNVTPLILAWIASVPDDSTLVFGGDACYRIDGTLALVDRAGLTFEGNGATFDGHFVVGPEGRSQWQLLGGSNFIFRNMTVIGSNPFGGVHTPSLQHQHAFDLRGAAEVEIYATTVRDVYGDGVYVGQDYRKGAWSSAVQVHDTTITRVGRNAISVTAGRDVRADRNRVDQVGFISFDVEPNPGAFGAEGVTFADNIIGSYYLYAFAIAGQNVVNNVTFTGNRLVGRPIKPWVNSYTGVRYSNVNVTGNTRDTDLSVMPPEDAQSGCADIALETRRRLGSTRRRGRMRSPPAKSSGSFAPWLPLILRRI